MDKSVAKDFIAKTGQTGVPVIEIGEDLILGFDKERISTALSIK